MPRCSLLQRVLSLAPIAMLHAAKSCPNPWGLPIMHSKQAFASIVHAAEAYPDTLGLPSTYLQHTFASKAHAAGAYPDPKGLPIMHLSKHLPAWRMQLRLTQIPGAYPACI